MTPKEWLAKAEKIRAEHDEAGILQNYAASAAMKELLANWNHAIGDGVRAEVVLHDIKEVIHLLQLTHDELKTDLPNVLDELAAR